MSYTPRTWVTGEIVTAPKLNNMEDGIKANDQAIATINQDITNIEGDIETINGSIGDIQGDITDINNDIDALETASGKTNASIADSFSAIKDYVKGDIVMYEGSTYVFTEDHAAGAWTGDDAETMSVAAQLKSDLNNEVDELKSALGAKIFKQNAISRSLDFDYTVNSGDYVQFEVLKWTGETPSSFQLFARVDGSNVRLTTVGGVNAPVIFKSNANYEHFRAYVNADTPQTSTEFVISISNLTRDNNELTVLQSKVNPQTSWLSGKKIGIVGDSISTYYQLNGTYTGYMNTAHYPVYSVKSVDETWWMRVISSSGAELDVNASVGGGGVTNQIDGKPSLYARADSLNNPDVVIISHGYNDANVPTGTLDFDTEYTQLSESTFASAYLKGVKAIIANYPSAKVVLLWLPKSISDRKHIVLDIAKHLELSFIDASGYKHYSDSNVHPDVQGMRDIASAVLSYSPIYADPVLKYEEITGRNFRIVSKNSKLVYAKKDVADSTGYLYVVGQNLCPTFNGGTVGGITYTVDKNGYVTANGTNNTSGNSSILVDVTFPIGGRYYTLSGTDENGNKDTYSLVLGRYLNGNWNEEYIETGSGYTFKADERYTYKLRIVVKPGVTMSNVVFKPQITEGMEISEYQKYSLQSVPITVNGSDFEMSLSDGVSYLYTGTESILTVGASCKRSGDFTLEQLEFDNRRCKRLFEDNDLRAASQTLLTDYSSGWEWGIVDAYIDGVETGRGVSTSTSSTVGLSKWVNQITVDNNIWFKLYVINLKNIKQIRIVFRPVAGSDTNSLICDVIDQVDHNGLNYVRVNLGDGTVTGTIENYSFAEMRLMIESYSTSSTTQVNFGHIYSYYYMPLCTLYFDDGDRSQYDNAYQVMKEASMPGDIALITGRCGDGFHITIPEIHDLVNDGWEVTNHTKNHLYLPDLSQREIDFQILDGKHFLEINGSPVGAETAVIPFDSRTQRVFVALEKYEKSARNNNGKLNTLPVVNTYTIGSFEVQQEVTVAQVKEKIDEAIAKKQWLVLLFHIIDNNDEQYHWLLSNFEQVIDYLLEKSDQIKVVNFSTGLLFGNGE